MILVWIASVASVLMCALVGSAFFMSWHYLDAGAWTEYLTYEVELTLKGD
jgi:hypothetical protein